MITATVAGHVGNDPEVKIVGDRQTPVLKFSVASSSAKGKDADPTWVRVSYFGERGQKIASYIRKGDRIVVSGRAELRKWEANGKSGVDLELDASDVHLVEKKDESRQSSAPASEQRQPPASNGSGAPAARRRF
jgi:single-strand DNA-binding protein